MKAARISDLLRLPEGAVDLASMETRATPGAPGGKATTTSKFEALGVRLSDLQERLYAQGRSGERRSALVVLQGMDTSARAARSSRDGCGSTRMVVSIRAFGPPTRESFPTISSALCAYAPRCHAPASSHLRSLSVRDGSSSACTTCAPIGVEPPVRHHHRSRPPLERGIRSSRCSSAHLA